MTSRISAGVIISIVILSQAFLSEGAIGDVCSPDTECSENEVCGSNTTCECVDGFGEISSQCVKECPTLDEIPSGTVTIVPNIEIGAFEAIYACISGYELEGEPRRRCLNTGVWEGSAPLCTKKACPNLKPPDNGRVTYSDGVGKFGSTADYTCVEGFEITGGDVSRECQANGEWAGIAPNCSEIVDPCKPNPCPTPEVGDQYNCVTNITDSSSHVCICPVGTKGIRCTEDDPPVSCKGRRNKFVLFETAPSDEDRTACFPKKNSSEESICFDADEEIVYKFDGTANITVDDSRIDRFCVTYINEVPKVTEYCVDIMAFEADDIDYRPWINETFKMCFVFNRKPQIAELNRTLVYNVVEMPDSVSVQLQTSDKDKHILILTVSAVGRSEFEDRFSFNGDSLIISNPIDLYSSNPGIFGDVFTVEITATDNGVPPQQNSISVNVQFVYEELDCKVPNDMFLVHLDPVPTEKINLGQIQCTAEGNPMTPTFEITNDAGPVVIEEDGTIVYDPSAADSMGNFRINVRANITLTLPVSSRFHFNVFAADFDPRCNPTDIPRPVPISEKADIGTCSGVAFICDDPANLTKTCTSTAKLFDVSCESASSNITEAKVCSSASLDFQAGKTETVSISVENEFGVHNITVKLSITNVNDPPKFVKDDTQIDIEISEETTPPTVLDAAVLPVADPDTATTPPLDNLTATITDLDDREAPDSLPFTADVNSFGNAVTVTLARSLNPKVRHTYLLQIKVEDIAGESDTVDLNITVIDVNEKPTCGSADVNTSATVRDKINYIVARLTCTDDDFFEQYKTLAYTLEGNSSTTDYFQVDKSGVVRLKEELTSFTSGTKLSFTVRVTDGGGLSETVQINVDVLTSYPPECDQYEVTETKPETTDSGDCFQLNVGCQDPVQNATLTFRDPSGNGTGLFTLKTETTTNDNLSLCTVKSLTGSVGEWHLNLMVGSSYGSRNIQVIIKVSDVNDAPKCAADEKNVDASVTDKEEKMIESLICNDPDVDTSFKTLTYTIEGEKNVIAYFKIDSGVISLAKPLSDVIGTNNVLAFTVRVEDGGGLFDTVKITVTVNNDFPPTCNKTEFEITISEATDADVCLSTDVGCSDTVLDETLMYTLTSGNGTTLFSEKDSTNAQIKLCTNMTLQGKYGSWQINAVVKSSFGETTLTGIVRVSDKNDKPEFAVPVYEYSVYENATVSTVLITVSATDQDSGAYGRLTYQSEALESSGLFSLNADTGEISVAASLDADSSDSNSYTFVVEALDGASIPLSASTSVSINVLDVNDEKPVCNPDTITVNIDLLTPLGTVIKELTCSDADITPDYSILEYSITSSYFIVNSTGHVTLTSKLPREETQHVIKVKVTDADKPSDPDFSTTVALTVNVDNNVPPVCTPETIVSTLKETDEIDVCLDKELTCTDPTGGEVTLKAETGTAKDENLLEIRIHSDAEKLGLNACVKSSLKDKFGEYKLIGTVTNGISTTTVTWTLTVENVNEAPVFSEDKYEIDIPEDTEVDTEILQISVSDPDDGKGDADFELAEVSFEPTNNGDFEGELSNDIIYLDAVRSFYSYREFNASVRNVYEYLGTAVDKSGLTSTVPVTIRITDVNSAPICNPTIMEVTITILAKEDDPVFQLACYDTDIEPKNVQLDYEIVSGDADGYFNVTATGEVIVQKTLPRDELIYNIGRADLKVNVSDRGIPSLATVVTAIVNINRAIPVTCKPAIIPPDIWINGSCVTIKMDCTDPTKDGTDHLTYEPSGNFTDEFTVKTNALGTIELCYTLTRSGIFQISVVVDNDLDPYTYTDIIIVSYSKATPVFSKSKYTDTVPESTEVGTVVLTVNASSAILVGQLEYHVLGDESTKDWGTYFSLDKSSGKISTLTGIKELSNTVITLKVEAVDTASQLRSSVLVELTVEDENETPTCTATSTNLNIKVDEAVNTRIIEFSCTDPDVKEAYRTLAYDISGTNVDVYFMLVGDPATSVAIQAPLDVTGDEYVITLSVSDSGTPPLSFSRDFTVNVNRLPPAVDVAAVALSFDTIRASWDYARPAFFDVTNSFKVKALSTGKVIVKESPELDSGTQTYEITGLSEVTEYIVVVEAVTDYGTRSSREVTVTTKAVPVLTSFTATIVVNIDYNRGLRDLLSQLYYETKTLFIESVTFVLKDSPGLARVGDPSFRPYKSVFADFQVFVNQSGNVDATIQKLRQSVSSGWVKQMSVQSDYFQASAGAGYILIEGLSVTPSEVYSGTEIVLECNITAVGYSLDEEFDFWWTYRGNRLYPTDQSRYSVSTTTDAEFHEYKHSLLRVNPILSDLSGLYGCHVSDSSGQQVKEKVTELSVISQPTVYITPKSQTLRYGENVNVTCGLAISPGTFEQFVWYRNGEPFLKAANEVISSTPTSMTIAVIGIKENVVYGCEGKNEAGNGVRVFSHLGVIPQDAKTDELCSESDDGRGTTWPLTAPDTKVQFDCKEGFTGVIYRICLATGDWEPPIYDCVREELETIEQKFKDIEDGSRPLNFTETLIELNEETTDNSLFEGDIDTAINSLDIAVGINDSVTREERSTRKKNFLETCSSLIDERNTDAWFSSIEVRRKGAIGIPGLVDQYNDKTLNNLFGDEEETITVTNIHITIGSGKRNEYSYPDRSSTAADWVKATKTVIVVQGEAFKDLDTVHFASSFYRNITPILVKKLKRDGLVTDITSMYDINSDIIAFQIKENIATVDPPAEIRFYHFSSNYSNPVCCYWDFDEGAFVTDGCTLVSTNDEFTVCHCNHFTNFAVLMSPGKTPEADVMALSIISAVGCGISILCLLLTIILHALVWRFVKSDRAVLLINLCVALIIAYVVFLAGVDRVENKDVCTAVSVLLHYFYLVVFFLMLAYGIEIAVSVVYVFVTRSRIRWLLPLAWGIPLAIVGISMGVTQLDGYGNETFCWLSIEDGLIWAFIGPAALIVLINFVIVVIVLRQMFKSSVMVTKSDKEKAVVGVRSICVLLPILGLTWVFGVFSVNERLVVFQYIFAICNTLQGFFIFLFHCILNKQLRQALKQRSERKKSLASIENTFKNQHSTTASTAFVSNEGKPTQNKDINSGTSNPFLEADRQMKELVGKNKKSANLNDNIEANNKVDVDKSSKAVDLDDVKISNIIRESEVMGGTTGISSILHADNRAEGDNSNEAPVIRSSAPSSHRYDYIDPTPTGSQPTFGIEKPPGYEKLLQGTALAVYTSKDSVHSGADKSRQREKEEKQREKEREKERERERERQKKIEKEKRDRMEKEKTERERMERENAERERKEREQRERERYQDRGAIRIGYSNEGYNEPVSRRRDGSHERRGQPRSSRSSRTDDDYEARVYERHIRMNRVYVPYKQSSGSSAQNVTSINTALPEKFQFYQGKKRQQKEAKKQSESSLKKKDKKKSSLKDRSKAYEYSYDTTYLGGSSRHSSLENMTMQNLGYSPYAQMPGGYGGYQTGRPAVQQQQWDQYGYARGPRDPRDYDPYARDPYRRDYW